MITATTRVAGVIGDPVDHSLSPAVHNAAYAALGLDWVYVAFPVPRGRGGAAVAALRDLGLAGLNVTMPHKADVAAACDDLTPDAAALASVNTVIRTPGGHVLGDSTDGAGFLAALAEDGIDVAGKSVLVLGAGGAARAVVLALGRAGAEVMVAARRPQAAGITAALAPGATAVTLDLPDPASRTGTRNGPGCRVEGSAVLLPEAGHLALSAFDLVVNATPLGMGAGDLLPCDPARLRPGQVAVDLIYHPAETAWLAGARAAGARPINGLGMLIHQAARSFTLWTGQEAPVAAMRAAAERALAERNR